MQILNKNIVLALHIALGFILVGFPFLSTYLGLFVVILATYSILGSKKYNDLTEKQKSFVKKEWKKYGWPSRRELEKIVQEEHILNFIHKNQPVDGPKITEDLRRNYRTVKISLLKLEREHKIKPKNSTSKAYVIDDEFKKKMLI